MAATFSLNCPSCNYRIRASTEHIGRTGRCPNCKALVEIKATGDEATTAAQTPADTRPLKPATTDSPGWLSGLLAIVATVLLYLALFTPLSHTDLGQKFLYRGRVMYFETLFCCWGAAILSLKYLSVRRQRSYAELELQLIPLEIGLQINQNNVDQFLNNLATQPSTVRSSILGRRISGALEHFRSRNNVSEVQSYLATQGEIDASAVDSGYTLLKALIWAIPILGFIGTVIGLSQAVGGLQAAGAGGDVTEKLQEAMGQVTSGLATAFDTTLVALIMAVFLLFPMESLRRTEYAMLDRIEQFANESLLRRLGDNQTLAGRDDSMPAIVRHCLESAFQQHQKWLAQWQAQVAQLGQVIGAEFEAAAVRVNGQLERQDAARQEKLHELTQALNDLFQRSGETTLDWRQSEQQLASQAQSLASAADRFNHSLAKVVERIDPPGNDRRDETTWTDLRAHLQRLESQIARLANAIEHGAGAADAAGPAGNAESASSAMIEMEPPPQPPRRGLFGRWRI